MFSRRVKRRHQTFWKLIHARHYISSIFFKSLLNTVGVCKKTQKNFWGLIWGYPFLRVFLWEGIEGVQKTTKQHADFPKKQKNVFVGTRSRMLFWAFSGCWFFRGRPPGGMCALREECVPIKTAWLPLRGAQTLHHLHPKEEESISFPPCYFIRSKKVKKITKCRFRGGFS